jgi:hypothetical protein
MKRLAILIILILIPATSALAVRHVVPVAGHLPGAKGTIWTTDLMLFNSLPQATSVTLVFYPTGGERVSRVVSLGPGESRLLRDVVNPKLFAGVYPESWMGQMEVVADGGVSVHARIYTCAKELDEGTYGMCFPVLNPSALLQRGILTGLVGNEQYRTNIALVNPSAMTITFHLTIRTREGVSIAEESLTIAPHQSVQIPLTALAPVQGDGYSLEWLSPDWDGYAVASVVDNGSGDPTGIPSAAFGKDSLFFPIVGKTRGAHGTNWATSLVLTADSIVAGNVELELTDNGTGTRTLSLPINAHGTITVDDIYAMFELDDGSGFLNVTSTVPLAGHVRVFNTVGADTYGSLLLSQDRSTVSGSIRIQGVTMSDAFRLNVAITNDNFTGAGGFIRIFDNRREQIYSEPFEIPARTTLQYTMPKELEFEAGEVVVQPNQNRTLSAVGSNIDNRTGDTVIIEGRN